jgi:CheY-like chemotaxis protein
MQVTPSRRRTSPGAEFSIVDSAPHTTTGTPPRALVVDDDRGIRNAVAGALRSAGYTVEEAETGVVALRLAQSIPDVIVLDLNLPDLSGLAICRALRQTNHTADVPIVFLTATDDEKTIASGFLAGAADYIVKPFVPEVLAMRINRVARARLAEIERTKRAEELSAATQALNEARATLGVQHRLSGLGILVSGVATEMNNPLHSIMGCLARAGDGTSPQSAVILGDALASAEQLADLVRQLRGIAGTDDRVRVDVYLRSRCELVARAFPDVHMEITGPDVVINAVDVEIREALIALIDNAARAARNGQSPTVALALVDEGDSVELVIDDSGPGIEAPDVPWLFSPFFSRGRGQRDGLGLSLVGAAVRRHGGTVAIEGHGPLGGARVRVRLPKQSTESEVPAPEPVF